MGYRHCLPQVMDEEIGPKRDCHGQSYLSNNWWQQNLNSDPLPSFFILHKVSLVCGSVRTAVECHPQTLEKQDTDDIHLHLYLTLYFLVSCHPKNPGQLLVWASSLCVRIRSALRYTGHLSMARDTSPFCKDRSVLTVFVVQIGAIC